MRTLCIFTSVSSVAGGTNCKMEKDKRKRMHTSISMTPADKPEKSLPQEMLDEKK